MREKDTFSGYHPLVNMLYFAAVFAFSMILSHPICLAISFVCAFFYALYLNGGKALRFHLKYMLPMLFLTALINPAFNHRGVTVLAYFPNGNPLTLESVLYGVAAAFMLITIITWFSCFNAVMTSDKFVYLFGRIFPALSLILAISLRLVPRYKAQIRVIADAQRCIGRDVSTGGVLRRARCGLKILSILVTWALESAIETADSMRCRGYGLPKRTAFSIFRFGRRDRPALLFLLFAGGCMSVGAATGELGFLYFPMTESIWSGARAAGLFVCYFALCAMPAAIGLWEDRKWKSLRSNI
jgi:energy-coupling factor transport system permease protein